MSKVVIYTTTVCPYCVNAKQLLTKKGVTYTEINIEKDVAKREEMIKLSGLRTVPQIFINGKSIGGFDALSALNSSGKLDNLLQEGNVS